MFSFIGSFSVFPLQSRRFLTEILPLRRKTYLINHSIKADKDKRLPINNHLSSLTASEKILSVLLFSQRKRSKIHPIALYF